MPGWLVRGEQVRAAELLVDCFRQSAQAASPEAAFEHCCQTFRQLFQAEAFLLCQFDPVRQRLGVLASSAPERGFFGELAVDVFPELQAALAEPAPNWIEDVSRRAGWQPLPSLLLEAQSLLVFPVVVQGRPRGYLLDLFRGKTPPPAADDLEGAQVLAQCVGFLLQGQALREQCARLRGELSRRRQLEEELHRLGLWQAGLNRLAAAAVELPPVEAAALYEFQAAALRRVAASGASLLLPLELPLGGSPAFPWQRALAESRVIEVAPDEVGRALEPWFPQLAGAHHSLCVLPLETAEAPLGVFLVSGPGPPAALREELAGAGLSLLATAALEVSGWRRRQQEAEERNLRLFHRTREGVFFVDATGRLLTANRALLQATGYALEEIERRSLADFLHPDDWQPLCAWLQERSERLFQVVARWRTKEGGWWLVEVTLEAGADPRTGPTPLLGLARDLGRERELEARASAYEARLLALLDSVHDGVWLIGADGTVEFANHRLGQLFGVNAHELRPGIAQRQATDRVAKQCCSPDEARARWQHLEANPEEVCWDEFDLREPRRRVLERFSRPLYDAQQRFAGRLEIYRDVTSQRLLEDKVLQREKLAAVGQLVSGIAHELNNPLTAVAGYAQLLLAAHLPLHLRARAERLAQEAERAGHIAKNLLLFARGAKTEKQPVDLADLLERTLALRAYELRVANIQVERDLASPLPAVLSDPYQLQQVFFNILLNAEQAIRSQRDHGRIRVSLRGRPEEARVRVEIADDGPGVPPNLLPYLFDPFFTTKPPEEGTGLGLSISQAIVKEHGGELFVHSASGEGATFVVELPAPVPQELPVESLPAPPPGRAVEKRGRRILVVDDEPAVAQLIADALEQQGYAVRVHTDSRRALAEAEDRPFQLAICDIRMPELDGQAFYRVLRERQSPLARRLLFTTGDTLARETAQFLEQVGLPCLAKPFRVEELRAQVRDLLHKLDGSLAGDSAAVSN